MKQNITREVSKCRNPDCHDMTANEDGYCDTCGEWEHHPFQPARQDSDNDKATRSDS